MTRHFLDTNVVVYAFSADRRAAKAQELLASDPVIGVQVLNEFVNVGRRKLGMSWAELRDALSAIRTLAAAVAGLDLDTHDTALDIAERCGYGIFDALIIAAALHAGCHTLWTEDLQHGAVIDGRLRIADPFRAERG